MELLNFMKASNGTCKSDLMKSFVAKHKEDPSPVVSSGGASLFGALTTTTTTTATTASISGLSTETTGTDTTDNANIHFQEMRQDNTTAATKPTSPQFIQGLEDNANIESNRSDLANQNTTTGATPTSTLSAAPDSTTTGDSNANVPEAGAVLAELRGTVPESRQLLLQQVTEATVESHLSTCINTHAAVSQARALQSSSPLPDLNKLSVSAGSMWEKMSKQMMPELTKAIQFSKTLPGFCELCLDDQVQLVKQGTFEVMMARFCMLIDHETETMLDPSHSILCPRTAIQEMPMGKFVDGFFDVATRFNPLRLSDGELALFTAMLVFSPSRTGLKEAKLVGLLHNLYQQALFTLFKCNHSEPENKFKKLLDVLPTFRRISDDHSNALMAMKTKSPEFFNDHFPPMHKEIYTQDQ